MFSPHVELTMLLSVSLCPSLELQVFFDQGLVLVLNRCGFVGLRRKQSVSGLLIDVQAYAVVTGTYRGVGLWRKQVPYLEKRETRKRGFYSLSFPI